MVLRVLARNTYAFSVIVYDNRNRNKCARNQPKQRARPSHTQVVIHCGSKQRESRAKRRANKIVPCKYARRISWVCVREVTQHRGLRSAQVSYRISASAPTCKNETHEEKEPSHRKQRRTQDRHNPVNARSRGPAEPEQADRDKE
jgi:hypothetical protein